MPGTHDGWDVIRGIAADQAADGLMDRMVEHTAHAAGLCLVGPDTEEAGLEYLAYAPEALPQRQCLLAVVTGHQFAPSGQFAQPFRRNGWPGVEEVTQAVLCHLNEE